ncbi:MAG: hypothetical protein ABI321_01735 [Polyangia bacterium]
MNIYIFFLRGGTSIGALVRSTRIKPSTQAPGTPVTAKKPTTPKVLLVEDPAGGDTDEVVLADGQTIAQALSPLVGKRHAATLENELADELDLAAVRAGQVLTLVNDADDRLVALEFRTSQQLAYRLDLGARKTTVSHIEGKSDVRVAQLLLPAGPALWEGLRRQGESAALGERLADLFGGDDWLPAALTSERLRVVVEKRMVAGRFQRYGRILGADWVSHSGLRRAFAWNGAYYTDRSESAHHRYVVSPLRPMKAQTSHHVLREKSDARYTVDWTAPRDSVVRAVAEGTVTGLTRGPAGTTLTLEVASGEHVIYSRLARPSRLVTLGSAVEQGHALGRTDQGVTLTYEGAAAPIARAWEEARIPSPRLPALPATERPRFGESIAPVLERLREIAVRASDPLASRALGAIP